MATTGIKGLGSTGSRTMSHSPLEFLYDSLSKYVEERRREPREDVLTGLATATFPDGSMPEVIDVVRVAANVFSAGQETTVRLLGAALQTIGDNPDIQGRLREDSSLIADFVEECLRFESPVKGDFRLARTGSTVGGVDIPAGSTVMVLNGAAGRDPRRFEEPDRFRMDRPNAKEHLAFGRGPHACPGGPLARAETRISIERLLARLGDIRISESAHGPVGAPALRLCPDVHSPRAHPAPPGVHARRPERRRGGSGLRGPQRSDHRCAEFGHRLGGSEVGEPDVDAFDPARRRASRSSRPARWAIRPRCSCRTGAGRS